MYILAIATAAKRRLRKLERSGKFDQSKFLKVLTHLRQGEPLPLSFDDHQLQGDMASLRECHIGFDLLIVYRRNELLKTVTITDIGTHAELFGR